MTARLPHPYPTCNRRGLVTRVCAKPAKFAMRIFVSGFEVTLLACVGCHDKAVRGNLALGVWDRL